MKSSKSESRPKNGLSETFFDKSVPRVFSVDFTPSIGKRQKNVARMSINGRQVGDLLDDNAYIDDGYRFHDAVHYTFATLLGWSPVVQSFFKASKKTSSDKRWHRTPKINKERLEECLVLISYHYSKKNNLFAGKKTVAPACLKLLRELCKNTGAPSYTSKEWKKTLLTGFEMFRQLRENNGGRLNVDLDKRKISYQPL